MHQSPGQGKQREAIPCPPLGTISVILVTPSMEAGSFSRIMSIALKPELEEYVRRFIRVKVESQLILGFSDEDKVGTFQPHDDALVVTLWIGGFDVKRVLVDQGSGAEIMYLDLHKGLNLKSDDLSKYDSSLVGLDGRIVIPKGMIKLLVQTGNEVVNMEFIVANAYSPYTAILARPWLHAIGVVSSTLHMKMKLPTKDE